MYIYIGTQELRVNISYYLADFSVNFVFNMPASRERVSLGSYRNPKRDGLTGSLACHTIGTADKRLTINGSCVVNTQRAHENSSSRGCANPPFEHGF